MAEGIQIVIEGENRASTAFQQVSQQAKQFGDDLNRVEAGANKVNKAVADVDTRVQNLTRSLSAQAGSLRSVIDGLSGINVAAGLAAAAVVVAGGAMIAAARSVSEYQEQLDIAAKTTGFTTNQFAGLRVAAIDQGRAFEQVRPSLDFFTRKIGEAVDGSEQAVHAFGQLGVAVRIGSQVRETGDVFRDVQVALAAIPDPAVRAQRAFELFGRGAAASLQVLLTPMDDATKRARELGLAFGPETEEMLRRVDTSFDRLKDAVDGIGKSFGVAAAEIVDKFLPSLAQAAEGAAKYAPLFTRVVLSGVTPEAQANAIANSIASGDVSIGKRPQGPLPSTEWTEAFNKAAKAAEDLADSMREFREEAAGAGVFPFQERPSLREINPGRLGVPLEIPGLKDVSGLDDPIAVALKSIEEAEGKFAKLPAAAERFGDALANTISSAILGVQSLDDAFSTLLSNIAEQLAQMGVRSLLQTLFSTGVGAVAGPVGAVAGVVAGGGFTGGGSPIPGPLPSLNSAAVPVTVHINAIDAANLDQFVRKQLVPKLREVLQTGSHR